MEQTHPIMGENKRSQCQSTKSKNLVALCLNTAAVNKLENPTVGNLLYFTKLK